MKDKLESLLLLLAVGSSVAIGAKRIGVPYNVAAVLAGLVVVFARILPSAPLDPNLVLLVLLPLLLFEAALGADAGQLTRAARPILALAVPGVALALFATGLIANLVLDLPLAVALLMGALLAITDTVSVVLAFRSVRVPHRLAAIMEGESLFNDGTALVLVSLCATIVTSGGFETADALQHLGIAIVGGSAVGLAFGVLGARLLRHMPDHLTAILASVVLVFGTSLLAERFHASPVIAVVIAGLVVGRAARTALDPSHVLALESFWETIGFSINVILFLLVGMQLDPKNLIAEAGAIALAVLALHIGRAVAVYGSFAVLKVLWRDLVPARWQHVMVIGNIKGALSMAAVLALPADLPYRERLVTIVFGVTLVTLVTQALPFEKALRWLKVTLKPSDERRGRAKATLISARRGQRDLDELLESGLISRKAHAEGRARFQRVVIESENVLHSSARSANGHHDHDPVIETALLLGRKAALDDAVRRGLIDSEDASGVVRELDVALLELSSHDGGEE